MTLGIRIVTFLDVFYLRSALDLATLSFGEATKVVDSQPTKYTACVIGAIMCSVSFLECAVNELFANARNSSRTTNFQRALKSVWNEGFNRQSILAKYQIALALAQRKPFGTGSEPYQSCDALIQLRNAMAHPKEIIGSDSQQQKLEGAMRGKCKSRPKRGLEVEFFPGRCLTPDCAVWAVVASARFFLEFRRRLPPTAYRFSPEGGVGAVLEQATTIRAGGAPDDRDDH